MSSMNQKAKTLTVALIFCVLTACGSGNNSEVAGAADPRTGSSGALASMIPVTRAQCTPFGNEPRPRNDLLDQVQTSATLCLGGSRLKDWVDGNGTTRRACLFDPGTATAAQPLPLVVFLQGSGVPLDVQLPFTNLVQGTTTADLTSDPAHRGFILLAPSGRITDHFYPAPNNQNTVGWDVWYRQFQPGSRTVNGVSYAPNADFAALDHYINEQVVSGKVDPDRIYVLGWSNGAALALEYGQNRANIAAVGMYSGPDPYDSLSDTCGQLPVVGAPRNDTELQVFRPDVPVFHVQNNCDIYATCPNGLALRDKLIAGDTVRSLRHQIIDGLPLQQATTTCNDMCGSDPRGDASNLMEKLVGTPNHLMWPSGWNNSYYEFLRDHPKR